MLPGQFKILAELLRSLADTLRSGLSDVKESAHEQKRAINDASETAEKQWREVPGIVSSIIKTSNSDAPAYAKSQYQKDKAQRKIEYKLQRRMLCATWVTAIATSLAFLAAGIYAYIAKGQLDQTIEATNQARRSADTAASALRENQLQFQQTLKEIQAQTRLQGRSADATQSAAATSEVALHISERAYISVTKEFFQFPSKSVIITIANSGHVPSGPVNIKVFEYTLHMDDPANNPVGYLVERHWVQTHINPISGGGSTNHAIAIWQATPEMINIGHQEVFVGAIITYNDGFPDTPDQTYRFCAFDVWDRNANAVGWADCDSAAGLDRIIKMVGYPQNEEKAEEP